MSENEILEEKLSGLVLDRIQAEQEFVDEIRKSTFDLKIYTWKYKQFNSAVISGRLYREVCSSGSLVSGDIFKLRLCDSTKLELIYEKGDCPDSSEHVLYSTVWSGTSPLCNFFTEIADNIDLFKTRELVHTYNVRIDEMKEAVNLLGRSNSRPEKGCDNVVTVTSEGFFCKILRFFRLTK